MGVAPQGTPEFKGGFPFQRNVLGAGSREEIKLAVTSDVGALSAIRNDTAFDLGPAGALPLGGIQFDWDSSGPLRFAVPAGVLGLGVTAGGKSGGGVYRRLREAFAAAGFPAPVDVSSAPGTEYLVLSAGYTISGSLSFSHPIGVLASAGVTWGGSWQGTSSVIVRLPEATGAKTAMASAVARWRLPRQVRQASDLAPGTWIAAQASGSLSIQLLARIGYDVNFLRELNLLGTSHSLSATIANGLEAAVGLKLSGEYAVLVGREDESSTVRLRLFRGTERNESIGVDLSLQIVTGRPETSSGSFVKLMLGIHGLQILGDLKILKHWDAAAGDLSKTPARLDRETGLDLLTVASGIDARSSFDQAQQMVAAALDLWSALPPSVTAELWNYLGNKTEGDLPAFLERLTGTDATAVMKAMEEAIARDPARQSADGHWLAALAGDAGVLSLLEHPDAFREPAGKSAKILDDGIIARIRDFTEQHLDLSLLSGVSSESDFGKLNSWLVARLGDFLGRDFQIGQIGDIKLAIAAIEKAEPEVSEKAQSAFSELFRSSVAASYERLTGDTALLDVSFDLDNESAARAFQDAMENSALDRLMRERIAGVTLHRATLTHGVTRTAKVQVHLPFFDSKAQHVNRTLATLQIEENAGRVLLYGLDSTDAVSASGRFQSELALLSKVTVANGELNLDALAESTVAYRSRQVRQNITGTELQIRTRPFLSGMIGGSYSDAAVLEGFYVELRARAGGESGLGDVALDFQVALPGSVLGLWLKQRSADERREAALRTSRALQRRLKELIPFFYFSDLSNLKQNPAAAALLVWSSIPTSTAIDFDGRTIKNWDTARDVFWDWRSPNLRNAVVRDPRTVAALLQRLAEAAARWSAAGDTRQASFFAPGQAGAILQLATAGQGSELLQSLLYTEAELVFGAQKAIDKLRDGWQDAVAAPAKTLKTLADFGARLSVTFHRRLSVYSSPEAQRTFNSLLLAEASRALAPNPEAIAQKAALTIFFLSDRHQFRLADFLAGSIPAGDDLRFARVITNFLHSLRDELRIS